MQNAVANIVKDICNASIFYYFLNPNASTLKFLSMILSIAIILLLGTVLKRYFQKLSLPGLLGLIIAGIIVSPHQADLVSEEILSLSEPVRALALIVILMRAGFGIQWNTLKSIGKPAMNLSFIPVVLEALAIAGLTTLLLPFSFQDGLLLGFIIAAVSPAVIVPAMLGLIENKSNRSKTPTLILSAASVDDIVAITFFGALLTGISAEGTSLWQLIYQLPLNVISGIISGAILAFLALSCFKVLPEKGKPILSLLFLFALSIPYHFLLKPMGIATLLGIMTIGMIILQKEEVLTRSINKYLKQIWIAGEFCLFVYIGMEVDLQAAAQAGGIGLILIAVGLCARSVGVYFSLKGSTFSQKEKVFCIISFIPKATVQAAIGAIPLSLGHPQGTTILSIAVLSIVITAPIGAIGIRRYSKNILE